MLSSFADQTWGSRNPPQASVAPCPSSRLHGFPTVGLSGSPPRRAFVPGHSLIHSFFDSSLFGYQLYAGRGLREELGTERECAGSLPSWSVQSRQSRHSVTCAVMEADLPGLGAPPQRGLP